MCTSVASNPTTPLHFIYRDESLETDIASTMSTPHLHLAHNDSRHDAPQPSTGTAGGIGTGAAGSGALTTDARVGTCPGVGGAAVAR